MPSHFVVREFAENNYYHIFNRGYEKRKIFEDKSDYKIFCYYLFIYLNPLETVLKLYPDLPPRLQGKNLSNELNLLCYCLMPNHFHLLLEQKTKNGISKFMKQLINAYTYYFNSKYKKSGALLQGRFKAVRILTDELLLHISRYIHLNPKIAGLVQNLNNYEWSSYNSYINRSDDNLSKSGFILNYFSDAKSYEKFVADQFAYGKELDKIKHLTIDSD